jgi:hypothetical protein
MSFYPVGYDPRDREARFLRLVNINTTDGDFGFMLGGDGIFTDVNAKEWYGSQLIEEGAQQQAINGIAPSGTLSMAYFQDPNAPDVIGQIKALGLDYIKGRELKFYFQPLRSIEDFYAPHFEPVLEMTRVMSSLEFSYVGELERRITLSYESWAEQRNSARRLVYSVAGHAALIGESNPSLTYMPTSNFEQEKLFG